MFEEEQVVVLLETMHVAYSGCVALFVLNSVSANLHPGAVLADLAMLFARMVLAEQFGSMGLLLVFAAAVVMHYSQGVIH